MSVAWKIKRTSTGEESTFDALRISTAVRTLVNQGVSSVDLYFGRGSILGALLWDYREEIQILRDGAVWFRGYFISTSPAASGAKASYSARLVDVWWYLENTIYCQWLPYVTDATADPVPASEDGLAITDFTTATQRTSTVLLMEDSDGHAVSTDAMIEDLLDYAANAAGISIQTGTIDTGLEVGKEEHTGITIAEAIKRCLQWTPDQTVWIDYTTSPVTLHCRAKANRAAHEIDITDEEVSEIEIAERNDLVVSGVRIEYIRKHERDNFTFTTQDVDEAGDTDGANAVIASIELYGSYMANGEVVSAEEVPTGVAQSFYDSWSVAQFEGRVALVAQDVPATAWLSKTLHVAGGNLKWATMAATIQSVTDDTFSGRTEIAIGPPQHLGIQDLVALVRAGKTEPPSVTDLLAMEEGGSPAVSKIPSSSGDPNLTFGPTSQERDADALLSKRGWWIMLGGGGVIHKDAWDKAEIWSEPGGTLLATIRPSGATSPPIPQTEHEYSYLDTDVDRNGREIWQVTIYISYQAMEENTIGDPYPADYGDHYSTTYRLYLDGSAPSQVQFVDNG